MTPAETRANHFARLNAYRNTREYQAYAREIGVDAPGENLPTLLNQPWEIDEEIYNEFLEMMPPMHWRGGSFFMCEGLFADVAARFFIRDDRYWCEYARYPVRDLARLELRP